MGLFETGYNMVNPKPSQTVNYYHCVPLRATPAKSGFRRENNETPVLYTVDGGC